MTNTDLETMSIEIDEMENENIVEIYRGTNIYPVIWK